MATTYLQAVNQVQRRLRETASVSVATDAYSSLIGSFVNEAKREVEDAWNWNCLRQSIVVTTIAGTPNYQLVNAGNRTRILNVYNETDNMFLKPMHVDDATQKFLGISQNGTPLYYSLNGQSGDDLVMDFYPVPDANGKSIVVNAVIPQADLSLDATAILVPSEPVILGAYMKALIERGEDASAQYEWAAKTYQLSLGTAIAQDESRTQGELIFYAV